MCASYVFKFTKLTPKLTCIYYIITFCPQQANSDKKTLSSVSGNWKCSLSLDQSILADLGPVFVVYILQLPEYNQTLQKGREIRLRLNQLYLKETELDQEHYGRALRLPNTTHDDVVRMPSHTYRRIINPNCVKWAHLKFLSLFFF